MHSSPESRGPTDSLLRSHSAGYGQECCDLLRHKRHVQNPIQEAAPSLSSGESLAVGTSWDRQVPGKIAVAMEPCQIRFPSLPSRLRRKIQNTGCSTEGNQNEGKHGAELLVLLFTAVVVYRQCPVARQHLSVYTYMTLVPLTI